MRPANPKLKKHAKVMEPPEPRYQEVSSPRHKRGHQQRIVGVRPNHQFGKTIVPGTTAATIKNARGVPDRRCIPATHLGSAPSSEMKARNI